MTGDYDAGYDQLNETQRDAVDWNDGPALVLAGPGSGKTTVITMRIARVLRDTPEKNFRILALTFTNKAADEMRSRVSTLSPGQDLRLFIGTFHAFCSQVLRQHGAHLGIPPDFTIYNLDDDRRQVLRAAKRQVGNNAPRDDEKKILERIDKLKSWFVPPSDTQRRFRDPAEGAKYAVLYQAYEDELRRLNALDFNALLFQTHNLFSTYPAIAQRYQRTYPYWLIDEFQDTNSAQYRLIKAMAAPGFTNILVVADDDQIIYEWNGASYKQLATFRTEYEPAILQLPTNYRCPAAIVAAVNKLVKQNSTRTPDKAPLVAGKTVTHYPEHECVRLFTYQTDKDEAAGIAVTIVRAPKETWGETVVLARNRSLLERLLPHLKAAGVSSVIAQRRDQFLTPQYRWLQACLRQIVRPQDENNVVQLINALNRATGLSLDPKDLLDQATEDAVQCLTAWTAAVRATDNQHLTTIAQALDHARAHPDQFRAFIKTCEQAFQDMEEESSDELLEDRTAWKELTVSINQAVGRDAGIDHFLQQLDLRSKEPAPPPDAVRLMTIHAAKGTEADHVYLIGMAEDYIPSFQSVKKGDASPEMEEERRNCFVAITRAKEQLTLSTARVYQGYGKKTSRFLIELGLIPPPRAEKQRVETA
ncbi:MAG TPA: ATP-dependent helicase [Candidatus Limnocylindrales bacterium]|nr:ATP-dependent helicase [Candidatus Limnocylindrales bacterium]